MSHSIKILLCFLLLPAASCVVSPRHPHEVSFSADGSIWNEESVNEDPPTPKEEAAREPPSPLHLWIPGYWWWNARWIWVDGCWHIPPRPNHTWVAGRWERKDKTWVWVRGRWE